MKKSNRIVLGGLALVAFVVAGGLIYWRSGHSIEYVPVEVELVLNSPGASFYVGDDYQGQGTLRLHPEAPCPWTLDQLGVTPGGTRWKPADVLPVLLSDTSIRIRKQLGHGTLTAAQLPGGPSVQTALLSNVAVFEGNQGADQFVLLRLELNTPDSDQALSFGPWRIRAYAPERPEFATVSNDILEATSLSSPLETWFFRRVRLSVRLTADVELVSGRPDLGPMWVERAEARRRATHDSGSPSASAR